MFNPEYVFIVRFMIFLVTCLMTYWSGRSMIYRCRLKICDFSDFSLMIVSLYWMLYAIWTLLMSADSSFTPIMEIWTFNMRFGLLLTLVAFTALIKDRLFISEMYETLDGIKKEIKIVEVPEHGTD